jgi:uncharacterized protein
MTQQHPGFGHRTVSFITTRPWLTLALSIVAIAVLAGGMARIKPNFTHTAFFKSDDPQLKRFEAFERRFGNDDSVVLIVHSPSGIFDRESADLLRKLTDRMWKVPEVIRVDSLANFNWVHAQGDDIEIESLLPRDGDLSDALLAERKQVALKHEILPGYLVSEDGTSALIYARIKPGIDAPPNAQLIAAETKKVVDELKGGDHEFHMTGGPILNDAFRESSQKDLSVLVPALLLAVAVLLVFTFRRAGGVAMAFTVIFPTVILTLAFSGWLGIEMSSVTFALPQVMIAVCVADAVHLLAGFYRARKAGMSRRDAAHHSLAKNMVATLLTSLTTALGFFSFVTANLPPIQGFGILAGVGTCVAWLVTYFLVGPMMVLWPGKEPVSGGESKDDELHESTPRSRAYIGFVDRHRVALVAGILLVTAGSVAIGAKNEVNSNPYEYFRRGLPVREAQEFVLHKLSGIGSFEVVIDAGREDGIKDPAFLGKVEAFERQVLDIPGINRAVSIVDILRQMNRALSGGGDADYKLPTTTEGVAQELLLYTMGLPQGMDVNDRMTIKNDAMRVTLISTITDSNEAVASAERIERIGKELDLDVRTTGKMLLYQGMNGHVVQSFLQSLGLALILIGFVMMLSFKSFKLGLISIIPNIVPLVAGGAVLYWVSGQLDIGTVLVSSVCLGIAVDNTIHIISNFNRHIAEGGSGREALEKLFAHAGPAMVSTTLILIAGFATLAFGNFMPNVYFGIMTASILGIAMFADFVLLPALLLMVVRDKVPAREAQALHEPDATAA